MELLSKNNVKTLKSVEFGYHTLILMFSPSTLSGYNVCPKASNGCAKACLNTAGMGRFDNVQRARLERTLRYFSERENFFAALERDIVRGKKQAAKKGLKLAIRLNGMSDLPTMAIKMAEKFPDVQFYDYTKIAKTFDRELPKNYHLTFSRSESNQAEVEELAKRGINIAVVFNELPETYLGKKVIDGDKHDLRFLDETNVIVGLTWKADAKKDETGFVVMV